MWGNYFLPLEPFPPEAGPSRITGWLVCGANVCNPLARESVGLTSSAGPHHRSQTRFVTWLVGLWCRHQQTLLVCEIHIPRLRRMSNTFGSRVSTHTWLASSTRKDMIRHQGVANYQPHTWFAFIVRPAARTERKLFCCLAISTLQQTNKSNKQPNNQIHNKPNNQQRKERVDQNGEKALLLRVKPNQPIDLSTNSPTNQPTNQKQNESTHQHTNA